MGFIKRAFYSLLRPSHSRTIGILIFFVLLAAVSLTVIAGQQQQQLRQRASAPEVCNDNRIPICFANPKGNSCGKEGSRCRNGTEIYECAKE